MFYFNNGVNQSNFVTHSRTLEEGNGQRFKEKQNRFEDFCKIIPKNSFSLYPQNI